MKQTGNDMDKIACGPQFQGRDASLGFGMVATTRPEYSPEWMTPPVSPEQGYHQQQFMLHQQNQGMVNPFYRIQPVPMLVKQDVLACQSPQFPMVAGPYMQICDENSNVYSFPAMELVGAKMEPDQSKMTNTPVPGVEWNTVPQPYKPPVAELPELTKAMLDAGLPRAWPMSIGDDKNCTTENVSPPQSLYHKPSLAAQSRQTRTKLPKHLLSSKTSLSSPVQKYTHSQSVQSPRKRSPNNNSSRMAVATDRNGSSSLRKLIAGSLQPNGIQVQEKPANFPGGGMAHPFMPHEPFVLGHAGDRRQGDDPDGENITLKLLLETPYSPRGKNFRNKELEEYQQMVAEEEVQKMVDELREKDRKSEQNTRLQVNNNSAWNGNMFG